ncbi:rab proteins geranylgeranyltransferase component A [Lucilia cuprina]|uniref:rab proteins geranylgeranyltransferase component A n=1 Tax=Lucilia cuprina TaxID=7375 RepID=UPI001F06B631|nr:rab proteins geranylgeranyltransferase component A [Lucilia cuprina]
MEDELPKEFDLIVIGTGFPESCVAAAASRIGKTVLHIDPNEYYGGSWASFNLDAYNTFLQQSQDCGNNNEIRNARYEWHIPAEVEAVVETVEESAANQTDDMKSKTQEEQWSVDKLMKLSRKFNLDLCPKILYSSGSLVQLLISSNICRYAEFRAVDRICTQFQGQLLNVPCSRSDVFNTKDLSIVEKRLLMKFLTLCLTFGEDKCEEDTSEFRGKTFAEYLRVQKVTEKINKCVMQAIAMANEETPFEVGMERTKKFLQSLGRYGNTPFIFPMYGCGEIPQCFCRLCAVFGGIYCLKRQITAVNVDESAQMATIEVDGQQCIKAKNIVCSSNNMPKQLRGSQPKNYLSRAIFLASTPLGSEELNNGGGGVNLLRLIDGEGKREAILIQLSHYSGTCPKGLFIFHLTTPAISDQPSMDLEPFVQQVFNNSLPTAPKLLYSSYFSIASYELENNLSTLIYSTAPPYYELDYDLSIDNARAIFSKLYENSEFLPRAPDPEEIVIEGEDPKALSEQQLPDDLREQLRQLEAFTEQMEIEEDAAVNSTNVEAASEEMISE